MINKPIWVVKWISILVNMIRWVKVVSLKYTYVDITCDKVYLYSQRVNAIPAVKVTTTFQSNEVKILLPNYFNYYLSQRYNMSKIGMSINNVTTNNCFVCFILYVYFFSLAVRRKLYASKQLHELREVSLKWKSLVKNT